MTGHSSRTPRSATPLVLTDRFGLARYTVDMESFFELSFWIAEELEDLLADWRHATANKDRELLIDRMNRIQS